MKRFLVVLGTVVMGGVLVAGCAAEKENSISKNQVEAVETMNVLSENSEIDSAELVKGLETVLNTVNELKETVNNSPKDVKKINDTGKSLEENWDKIEKAVEKRDPEAYENIEKSLYPLIAEAQKATLDIEKIKPLIEETMKKITEYKESIS